MPYRKDFNAVFLRDVIYDPIFSNRNFPNRRHAYFRQLSAYVWKFLNEV